MDQITVRGIPPEIEKAIRNESKRKNISLNKTIVSLLKKAVGGRIKKASKEIVYHDIDHLSGAWSRDEAQQFERNLKDQRQIDEDVWK